MRAQKGRQIILTILTMTTMGMSEKQPIPRARGGMMMLLMTRRIRSRMMERRKRRIPIGSGTRSKQMMIERRFHSAYPYQLVLMR